MRGPNYWMAETGGELQSAVHAYLKGEELSQRQINLIRDYLKQWANSGVWDLNPNMHDAERDKLNRLRRSATLIRTRQHITLWISHSVGMGMDPL